MRHYYVVVNYLNTGYGFFLLYPFFYNLLLLLETHFNSIHFFLMHI